MMIWKESTTKWMQIQKGGPNPSCLYKKILAGNLYCSPSPPRFVAEIWRRIKLCGRCLCDQTTVDIVDTCWYRVFLTWLALANEKSAHHWSPLINFLPLNVSHSQLCRMLENWWGQSLHDICCWNCPGTGVDLSTPPIGPSRARKTCAHGLNVHELGSWSTVALTTSPSAWRPWKSEQHSNGLPTRQWFKYHQHEKSTARTFFAVSWLARSKMSKSVEFESQAMQPIRPVRSASCTLRFCRRPGTLKLQLCYQKACSTSVGQWMSPGQWLQWLQWLLFRQSTSRVSSSVLFGWGAYKKCWKLFLFPGLGWVVYRPLIGCFRPDLGGIPSFGHKSRVWIW